MSFNSLEFLIFLPVVFVVYWLLINNKLRLQNAFVLTASYVFYGWWDWRFLSLIIASTLVDYFVGISISKSKEQNKKYWLWLSMMVNLGFLGFFKYYNFFVESWIDAWSMVGYEMPSATLNIILPLGISFYTFQTMSYALDVYNDKIKPTRDFISFAAYVAFFPQLVAGPIERATSFMPQVLKKRTFDYKQVVEGLRLILWGMFKKVVIADTLALTVDTIFADYTSFSGSTLVLGAVYFGFQVYADFSGYSDMAIGTAKLFGFELMSNFKFPFFSRSIPEYWRRWHVSLYTWFNDYLFFQLAMKFRYWGKYGLFLAIFLTFTISGLWHGAAWTFVIWGMIHGLYFIPNVIGSGQMRSISSKTVANETIKERFGIKDYLSILKTFTLVSFTWIFFRSPSLSDSLGYMKHIALEFDLSPRFGRDLIYVGILLLLDAWFYNSDERKLQIPKSKAVRWLSYSVIIIVIIYHSTNPAPFIYFQF